MTSTRIKTPPVDAAEPQAGFEDDYAIVPTTKDSAVAKNFPVKNRAREEFIELAETKSHTTFHPIVHWVEIVGDELYEYVFKENTPGKIVSELEAGCAGIYAIVAPRYTPVTHAVYGTKTCMHHGVISRMHPGFETLTDNPLRAEDLDTSFIDQNNLTIELLEELHDEFWALQEEQQRIERKIKYQEYLAKQQEEKQKEKQASPAAIKNAKLEQLEQQKEAAKAKMAAFHQRIQQQHKITEKNFENYRIVKGLAIALAVSYIFLEDDLHEKNLSKFGFRIDFDMSLWKFLYAFKESIKVKLREPKPDMFRPTLEEFCNFPRIKRAGCFWPTNVAILPPSLSMSKNDFSEQNRENFKKFKVADYPAAADGAKEKKDDNKKPTNVFAHHFFATMSRYIMSNEKIYQNVFEQHIRPGCHHPESGRPFIPVLTNHQKQRIRMIGKVLPQVPGFFEFFRLHGRNVYNQLKFDLKQQGVNFNPDDIRTKYEYLMGDRPGSVLRNSLFADTDKKEKPKKIDPANEKAGFMKMHQLIKDAIYPYTKSTWKIYSLFQANTDFADILWRDLETWQPDKLGLEANVARMSDMTDKISCELSVVYSGAFYDTLVKLQQDLEKVVQQYQLPVSVFEYC